MSDLASLPAGAYSMSLSQRVLEQRYRTAGADVELSLQARVAQAVDGERVRVAFERAATCFEVLRAQLYRSELLRDPVLIDTRMSRVCWKADGHCSDVRVDDRDLLEGALCADADGVPYLRLRANPVFVDPRTLLLFVDRMNAVLGDRPCDAEQTSFRTLVEWQAEVLQSPETRAGVEYWQRHWSQANVPVRLPWFRRSSASPEPRCASCRTALLDADLIERIEQLAARRAVTPETVFLTAWLQLLAQMSEADALPFYWLRDERAMDDFVSTGGPLTKPLPFVIDLPRGADFAAVLERCRRLGEDADEWAVCYDPGAQRPDVAPIEFAYHFERAAGDGPLVPEALSYHGEPVAAQLSVLSAAGMIRLTLTFDGARLLEPFVALWLPRLVAVLEAGCATTTRGQDFAIWPAGEQQRVLAWSQTGDQTGGVVPIVERVRRHSEITPDEIALVTPSTTLTYASLWRMSGRVAAAVERMGPGADCLVGLMLPESDLAVGAMLGVWRAGATWLMLDAAWPPSRIRQVLGDNGVGVVVAPSELLAALPDEIACALAIEDVLCGEPTGSLSQVNPGAAAYVLMTSGSTGTPKAITVTHANLARYVDAIVATAGLAECRRFLACTTLAADLAYSALFPALSLGRAALIAGEDMARDPAELASFARRHLVDFCKTVPTHLLALTAGAGDQQWLPRMLMTGGEALPAALVQRLHAGRPDVRLWNHYGPAETTIGVISGPVSTVEEHDTAALGRPLPGSAVYILDRRGAPAVVGTPGEIYIGGPQVGLGYWRQPAVTADRFVPDPFSRQPGARLYRTGDLGRWRPDGSVGFLGRVDRQMKIRGHRVELEEIERALVGHECVEGAAVVAVDGPDGHTQLRACVVPHQARARALRVAAGMDAASLFMLPNGTAIAQVNRNETRYLFDEIFQRRLYLRHGITIQDGDWVVDAGANIGMFGLFALGEAAGVAVHSFEPMASLHTVLDANARMSGPSWMAHHAGLADGSGRATFTYYPYLTLLSGRYADLDRDREVALRFEAGRGTVQSGSEGAAEMIRSRVTPQAETCAVVTLSEAIREHAMPRIDLLKVDVQGSEQDLLRGIEEPHWRLIAQIVVECTSDTASPIAAILEARGFSVVVDVVPDSGSLVYAVHPDRRRRGPITRPLQPVWRSAEAASGDLRSFLEQRLPNAMVPAQFIFLPELPYTSNGKLDRVALAARAVSKAVERVEEPPANDVESALAEIWASLLGRDRIDRGANFFALGGDSILAIQLVARAREQGFRMTPRHVFDHPTIAALARRVDRAPDERPADAGARSAPLSAIQRWFAERLPDRPETFVQAVAFDVDVEIDAEALERAYRVLVSTHPMLCAQFDLNSASGSQSLPPHDAMVPIVHVFDHRALTEADADTALREALVAVRDELDVRFGRLFAMCYQRRTSHPVGSAGAEGGSCGRLVLIAHHLVSDAVSLRIVVEDLLPLLRGESSERPGEVTSYLDWVHWLHRNADRIADEATRDWWHRQIADSSTPPTPASLRREVELVWPADLTTRIRALTRAGVTVQSVVLAAYGCALCEWASRSTVTIDVEGHGRHTGTVDMDLSRTVGWFTTLYPLNIRIHADARETVDSVTRALRAVGDGGLSYSVLRHVMGTSGEQQRWRSPAWARFNYLGVVDMNERHAGFALADESFTWLRGGSVSTAGRTIALSARITGDVLRITLEHAIGEASDFAGRLRRAAEEVVTAVERASRDDEAELAAALEALESGK